MPDITNDIDALIDLLAAQSRFRFHSALTALVAERNKLAEDLKWQQDLYDRSCGINSQLRQRIAELEAKPADRDLRERNDAMARWMNEVTGMLCHGMTPSHEAKQELVNRNAAAIAAMRKENTDA